MPGGDGTGPGGLGPMTGRAAGYCAGYPIPGFMNPIPGRGYGGWGRGGGWGRRNRFYATGLTGSQRAAYGYPAFGGTAPYGYPAYGGAAPYSGYGGVPAYGTPYAAHGYPAYGVPYASPAGRGYGGALPYGAPMTREQEVDGLKGEAEYLEDALDGIKKRIRELEAEAK